MLGLSLASLLVLAGAVLVGALVQSVVGLGVSLVFAPVVAFVAPQAMPAVPLWTALATALFSVHGEHGHISGRVLAWGIPARVPGTVVGLVLVARASERHLGVAVAVMVLVAVGLTWRAVHVEMTPVSLMAAGFTSGVTGTATSIGGPPMALLMHRRPAPEVRSTLAVYFVAGIVFSLVGLAIGGSLPLESVWVGLLLWPFVGAGVLAGRRLRGHVPAHAFRVGVLVVCAASAVGLLARSLA